MSTLKENLKKIGPLKKVVRFIKSHILGTAHEDKIRKIRIRLEKEDKKNTVKDPSLIPLHKKLNELKIAQVKKWNSYVYCDGYFYQGYKRIGINGMKPTEERIENYGIEKYFLKTKKVLDIGSNSGFMVCYISGFVKEVDGIELNPYLVEMGLETQKFLSINNVYFITGDFISYEFKKTYDIIFSLSNHYTIDGNLNVDFESYIKKIYNLLNKDGIMIFESHNINGDDKDMDEKFYIASKYFKLIEYKMVKAFFPTVDIDKLFAVFFRLDEPGESKELNFKLSEAKNKYQY